MLQMSGHRGAGRGYMPIFDIYTFTSNLTPKGLEVNQIPQIVKSLYKVQCRSNNFQTKVVNHNL
jgi:hypothetical protein